MKIQVRNMQSNHMLIRNSISIIMVFSILNLFAQGTWTQKADWTGCYAQSNTAVSVGNKAYVGLGTAYCRDWREFDPVNDTWSPMDTLPSIYSQTNMAFAINNKAYVLTGGGYIGLSAGPNPYHILGYKNELWEYDINSGSWAYVNDFPSDTIIHALSFSVNGKGYILGGAKPEQGWVNSSELWEFDPMNNSWTQKTDFIGVPFFAGVSFVIDGIAYVGGGTTQSGILSQEFYSYNPVNDQWLQVAFCPKLEMFAASSFAVNGKGYVGMGLSIGTNEIPYSVWEFDPINDEWNRVEDLPDNQCIWDEGVGFSINGKGYMGLGDVTCNQLPIGYYPYIYEYTPETNSINSFEDNMGNVKVFPSVSSGNFQIKVDGDLTNDFIYEIRNIQGKIIANGKGVGQKNINLDGRSSGMFLIVVETSKNISTHKIIKY